MLLCHFTPDALETLLAIAVKIEAGTSGTAFRYSRTHWIPGGVLLRAIDEDHARGESAAAPESAVLTVLFEDFHFSESNVRAARDQLTTLEPSLFLIDLSDVSLDRILRSTEDGDGESFATLLVQSIKVFTTCAVESDHRVTIAAG